MRHIEKTEPPIEFVEYLKTPGVCFGGLNGDPKRALRKRLLEDQGYICCYCGCRISNDDNTKIEHIKCQKRYPSLALEYNNMLASCDGGAYDRTYRIRPKHNRHCDDKKGDNDIPVSPLDTRIEELLTYFEDGTVVGTGEGKDLVDILGLNVPYLVSKRKSVIKAYIEEPPGDPKAEIIRLKTMHEGKFDEYCFVLEQYVLTLIINRDEIAQAM